MNEYTQEFGAMHEGSYAGESPLQEILGHEGNFGYAQEYHEAPYQEVFEAPYQEMAFEDEGLAGESSAYEGAWNEVLGEDEVFELTSELLEVQSEDEMDRFLASFSKVGHRADHAFADRQDGGAAQKVAALPIARWGAGMSSAVRPGDDRRATGEHGGAGAGPGAARDGAAEADFAAARQFVRGDGHAERAGRARRRRTRPPMQAVTGVARNSRGCWTQHAACRSVPSWRPRSRRQRRRRRQHSGTGFVVVHHHIREVTIMSAERLASVLHREARAPTRLDRMTPFSVSMTMVPAAAIRPTRCPRSSPTPKRPADAPQSHRPLPRLAGIPRRTSCAAGGGATALHDFAAPVSLQHLAVRRVRGCPGATQRAR